MAVILSDVTEVAPVTTPASTFTVPSRTTAEPDAGVIFIAPKDVLSVTAASPRLISSANTESAAPIPAQDKVPLPSVLNTWFADPSAAGNLMGTQTLCYPRRPHHPHTNP